VTARPSFAAIGKRIGISRHAARGVFIRAIRKLQRDPEALPVLLVIAALQSAIHKEGHRAA
jgi:hypothetical protein